MVKNILTALLVLALLAGGWALYSEIRGQRADLKALKDIDEKAQAKIAEKEAANALLLAANIALREKDAASEVEKQRLLADLSKARLDNDKLRADLKTAPPETVLAQTKQWLSTQEIWLRANAASQAEAVFSLAAFRLNADALAERQYLKFTLVPNVEGRLRVSEGQNATKAVVIANLEQMVQNATFIIEEKDTQLDARAETIGALKKRNFWRTVGLVAGSFTLGYISHR